MTPAARAMPNMEMPATPAPAPAPGSKEQKLADLLDQYKRDQVSAAEYHKKRAEIMAEH
jgi:hypothetical protein